MNSLDFALRRPTTVMVTMVDIILGNLFTSNRMHTDVFPDLNMPIIYVAQADGGITPGNEVSYEILFSGPV
jgi:multidrug efflux pump subunit AcrB